MKASCRKTKTPRLNCAGRVRFLISGDKKDRNIKTLFFFNVKTSPTNFFSVEDYHTFADAWPCIMVYNHFLLLRGKILLVFRRRVIMLHDSGTPCQRYKSIPKSNTWSGTPSFRQGHLAPRHQGVHLSLKKCVIISSLIYLICSIYRRTKAV